MEFILDQSHQELASQIGTVRELVSRSFARFQEQEILSVRNRTITILSMDRLKEEAASTELRELPCLGANILSG